MKLVRKRSLWSMVLLLLVILAAGWMSAEARRAATAPDVEAEEHAAAAAELASKAAREADAARMKAREAGGHAVGEEHEAKPGVLKRLFAKHPVDEEEILRAHEKSADADLQRDLAKHHLDTSAVDEGSATVLGRVKSGVEKVAEAVGLKKEHPEQVVVEEPVQAPGIIDRIKNTLHGASNAAGDTVRQQAYEASQSAETLGDRLKSYFTRARAIPEEEQVVEEAGGPGLGARLFGRGKEAADEAAEKIKSTAESARKGAQDTAESIKERARSASESAEELTDELLKATGARPKTLGDKVSDTLESLHLKEKPATKAAAEKVAASMPHIPTRDEIGEGIQDVRDRVAGIAEGGKAGVGGGWDTFLKQIGLRDKSTIEKAVDQYHNALHEVKVALGTEDRSAAEKINNAFSDATNNIKDTTLLAYEWIKSSLASVPGKLQVTQPEPSVLDKARDTWERSSAKTLSSLFRARDTASEYTDAALKKAGLREEHKSLLQRTRDNIDAATHRLMVALGYHQPTLWERMTGYEKTAGTRISNLAHETAEKVPGTQSYKAAHAQSAGERTAASIADTWDATLKKLHLREKSTFEKAADRYYDALNKMKHSVGMVEPTTADRFSAFAEDQRNRVNEVLQSLYEDMPSLPAGVKHISDLPEAARRQYAAATSRMEGLMNRMKVDADHTLKNMGWRDKTFAEAVRDNITSAWHDFKTSTGIEEPGYLESLQYQTGTKGGLAGMFDRALKFVGLRDKSAIEKARDNYDVAIHKFKTALGTEDPFLSERITQALSDARERVNEVSQYVVSTIPGGGTIANLPAAARDRYEEMSAGTIASLMRVRDETDRLLKHAGLKERSKLEEARGALDEAMHSVWVTLGYEEPTLLERVESLWHKAKVKLGAEEPTLLEKAQEKIQRAEARVSASGQQVYEAGEEVLHKGKAGFAGIKHAFGGG